MTPFTYIRAADVSQAALQGSGSGVRFLAGGTNLVDLLKENVERPDTVVDIGRLPYKTIEALEGGGLRLGALVTNSHTANDARVQECYPLLASAILAGASPQLRNAATNGGNLNQRTRCLYFYDLGTPCNKREPGSGCSAIGGLNRMHAILGASEDCIATHPSDMCVALAALEAIVQVQGPHGQRQIPIAGYHRLPGSEPWRDNNLQPGEVVWAIDLPPSDCSVNYSYLKLRDRLSYAFALVSVAVGLDVEGDQIKKARIALGGVAHKPWRVPEVEESLVGKSATAPIFREAARQIVAGAVGQGENDFKIELAERAVTRALAQAAAGNPQSQADKRIA